MNVKKIYGRLKHYAREELTAEEADKLENFCFMLPYIVMIISIIIMFSLAYYFGN